MVEHRIARKLTAIVQHRASEPLHSCQVNKPIMDALGKDRGEQIVFADRGVKALDHLIDEVRVDADVFSCHLLFRTPALRKSARINFGFAGNRSGTDHRRTSLMGN